MNCSCDNFSTVARQFSVSTGVAGWVTWPLKWSHPLPTLSQLISRDHISWFIVPSDNTKLDFSNSKNCQWLKDCHRLIPRLHFFHPPTRSILGMIVYSLPRPQHRHIICKQPIAFLPNIFQILQLVLVVLVLKAMLQLLMLSMGICCKLHTVA